MCGAPYRLAQRGVENEVLLVEAVRFDGRRRRRLAPPDAAAPVPAGTPGVLQVASLAQLAPLVVPRSRRGVGGFVGGARVSKTLPGSRTERHPRQDTVAPRADQDERN